MKYLQKLPGYRRYPPGLEWRLLKRLPMAFVASTAIPAVWYLAAQWFPLPAPGETVEKHLKTVEIATIATVITAWTAVFTIAIGCCIVILMKGPAYVADRYPLSDAEQPRRDAADGRDPADDRRDDRPDG